MTDRPTCDCLTDQHLRRSRHVLHLHAERQDTQCDAWKRLLDLIERAADDGRERFAPAEDLGWEDWWRIVSLPPTIAKLKVVKVLYLYGSALVRVPPEIGEMDALEEFDPYTSYRLHWFPYEITRCARLRDSRVSTRALYGNPKYRPPFPRLPQPDVDDVLTPAACSVCRGRFGPAGPRRRWVSLRVATDVLPLLVHACSDGCVTRLPTPPAGCLPKPHVGGPSTRPPPRDLVRP